MEQGINPKFMSPTSVANKQTRLQRVMYYLIGLSKNVLNIIIVLLLFLVNVALVVLTIFSLLTLDSKSDIISIAIVVAILVVTNYSLNMNRRELNGREHISRIRR